MQATYLVTTGLGIAAGVGIVWAEHQWHKSDVRTCFTIRALVLSVLLAGVFSLLYYHYGLTAKALSYLILAVLLCAAALTDVDSLTIPNALIITGIVCWFPMAWFTSVSLQGFELETSLVFPFGQGFLFLLLDGLVGASFTAGGVLLFAIVYEQITDRFSLGGGDIKLLFVTGLYLGLVFNLVNLFLSCLVGSVFARIWQKAKERQTQKAGKQEEGGELATECRIKLRQSDTNSNKTFPFAPAIVAATLFLITCGPWLRL